MGFSGSGSAGILIPSKGISDKWGGKLSSNIAFMTSVVLKLYDSRHCNTKPKIYGLVKPNQINVVDKFYIIVIFIWRSSKKVL